MALITADRVYETTTTTGSGNLTLAGAITGFQAFSAVCANNDTFYYAIEGVDASGNATGEWETGLGTFVSATPAIARTTVSKSSNGNAAVVFSAGTKRVALSAISANLSGINTGDQSLAAYAPLAAPSFTGGINVTGNIASVSSGAADNIYSINSPTGQWKLLQFLTGGSIRWAFGGDNAAESGSNAGTNFGIARYTDAAAFVDYPFQITRSSGQVTIPNYLSVTGSCSVPTVTSDTNSTYAASSAYVQANLGTTAVSTTGGVTTLSAAQAAASVIVLTGVLASNATINFGSGSAAFFNRTYTVVNNTTGAFTVTLQACVTGPSGSVVVTQATSTVVYTNAAVIAIGSGNVTSVSVTTVNGVSGTVATATTTPAISLTLGAITPTSVAASGTVTGSNLSGTNTGNQSTIVGITGTLAQFNTACTDATFAPIAAPTFTGVPAAPTAAASTSTTQLATTAFATTADNLKANLAGPTFTGVPAAPTAAYGTNTTQLATTAFVDNLLDLNGVTKTAAYTLALTDRGGLITITTGGITVPANASVAFPIGAVVTVYNNSAGAQTIAITTDTMYLNGTATTGTRTLAIRGLVTLTKVLVTTWVAAGAVT